MTLESRVSRLERKPLTKRPPLPTPASIEERLKPYEHLFAKVAESAPEDSTLKEILRYYAPIMRGEQ